MFDVDSREEKKKEKVGSCEKQGAPPLMKYERSGGMLMLRHPLAYQRSDYGFSKQKDWKGGEMRVMSDS